MAQGLTCHCRYFPETQKGGFLAAIIKDKTGKKEPGGREVLTFHN